MQQYSQLDPTLPPIPRDQSAVLYLYEEEKVAASKKNWTGVFRPLFRALGWDVFESEEEAVPESVKVAKRKHEGRGGLFERE